MFWRKSIENYARKLPAEELVQRTRIVVIDDDISGFPLKVLQRQGYSIDHWPDVKDLQKLESGFYDIIILDIVGVGQELDEEMEGAAVLKHLKEINPFQVVVAYSAQSHEPERISFFQLSDQFVPKTTSAINWKEIIDDLMTSKLTVGHFWSALESLLKTKGVTSRQIKKVEKKLISASKSKTIDLSQALPKILGPLDNIGTIIVIAVKIISLCLT